VIRECRVDRRESPVPLRGVGLRLSRRRADASKVSVLPAATRRNPGFRSDLLDRAHLRLACYRNYLTGSRLHLSWMGLWSVVGMASTVIAPLLIGLPVVLMALAPRLVFVSLAAVKMDLLSFVALGTLRLSVTDPSYFIVGRRAAQQAADFPLKPPRGPLTRLVSWFVQLISRSHLLAAVVLFLRPNSRYLAVAGWNRVPGWVAGVAASTGTMVYLVAVHSGITLIF